MRKEWPHAAYSPRTGLLYTPTVDHCARYTVVRTPYREGMYSLGGEADIRPFPQRAT